MKRLCAIFFVAIAFGLLSCAKNDEKGQKFLLPWPDQNGEQSLQVINIETLGSPYKLSGSAAKVYLQTGLSSSGFIGDPASPKLTISNNLFVPLDAMSSLGLVLYAHFERLQKLDQMLGLSQALAWPRNIGYEILVQKQNDLGLEFDNARYFLDWDVVTFLPTSSENTPLAVNPGVIAHEHYHAHFNSRVMSHLPIKKNKTKVEKFNEEILLRGWNEGLSDYYGFVYSKNPDFLTMSLGTAIGKSRDVDISRRHMIRASEYFLDVFNSLLKTNTPVSGLGYGVGTDLARMLYIIVERSAGTERLSTHVQMLKYVTNQLANFPQWYLNSYSIQEMEPAAIFDVLFFQREKILTKSQCREIVKAAPYFYSMESLEAKCL